MKRILATMAAVLAMTMTVVTPAQAAPPLQCTSGSYSDLMPPRHTHWVMGERFYAGGSVIFNTTYRLWLHEDSAYSPPLFVAASRASCGVLSQTVQALQPVWQSGTLPCLVTGEYQDPSNSSIHHVFIGQRVNRIGLATANFRFWMREERTASGIARHLDSSVAMC